MTAGRQVVDSVDGILEAVAGQARRWGRSDLAKELTAQRERLNSADCYVVVVGEFGKGKSTLVNSLLGTAVTGVNDGESTTVPVLVKYGKHPQARLLDRARGDQTADEDEQPVETAAVPAASTQRPPPGIERSICISIDNELLAAGLVLVDTPGVGGGLAGARSGIALRALANADAVLFVTDASQELTAPEISFLRQIVTVCPDVLCVLTKTDFYPEWRRIRAIDEAHLRSAGIPLSVLPISAPLRLHANRTADSELNRISGYPQLVSEISRRMIDRVHQRAERRAVDRARSCLGQLLTQAAAEQESLTGPPDPDLADRWQRARVEADRLRGAGAQWQQLLADRGAELVSTAELDLSLRLRGLRAEAVARIETTDPAKTWTELEPWLYGRANEAVLAHYAALRTQADELASDVGELFGRAIADLGEQLDMAVVRPSARTGGLATAKGGRVPWSEVAIHAARGTSLGVAVTHAAILLPGLTLLSVLPVTALFAVVLGRRMVRSARDAQLKIRRAEATRAVQTYLDEAEILSRKDSRDTVRRVQQRVRDYFTSMAVDLQRSAAASLQAVEGGLRADAATRMRRRQRLTEDLRALRPLVAAVDQISTAMPPQPLPSGQLVAAPALTGST